MTETTPVTSTQLSLIDESFDVKNSGAYHLSVLIDKKHFAYSLLDSKTNKYIALYASSPMDEEAVLESLSLQLKSISFNSVTCALATHKFTLVPTALFEEENKNLLFHFCYDVAGTEEVCMNNMKNLNAKNIFSIPKKAGDFIKKTFSNARIIHSSGSFIEGLLLLNKNNSEKKVYADFHSNYFELVLLEGRNLLLSNTFKYKTAEDIAYYILFVYEQLGLNPEEIELTLSGLIEKVSAEHSLLFNYIRHVKFASLPDTFKYTYKIESIQPHTYFSLFNQYLCV